MLTIVGDWQPFLGVNVPHLDCVGCGMSEGRIVEVVVERSVVRKERNSTKASFFLAGRWWTENPKAGVRVVRRLAPDRV